MLFITKNSALTSVHGTGHPAEREYASFSHPYAMGMTSCAMIRL